MSLFVDASVWSLALRRNAPSSAPDVEAFVEAIEAGETILTTGLALQELLQGFSGPKDRDRIVGRFSSVPLLPPYRSDHIAAAELRNRCRRHGAQVGAIDAILAQLCIRHDLTMLSTDMDFSHIAKHSKLRVWRAL